MFGLIAAALASPPFELGALEPLPIEPTDVAIYEHQLLLLGSQGGQVRTPSGWEDAEIPGGNALLATPGGLLICSPSGVFRVVDTTEKINERPCSDIAQVGDAVWLLSSDGVFLLSDDTPVELTDLPDSLGGGEAGAWVKGNQLFIGSSPRLVFPGSTDVGLLQKDGAPVWALLHPERKLFGLLGDAGLEAAWPLPFAATHLTTGTLGEGEEPEIILVGSSEWAPLRFLPASAPPSSPAPKPLPTYRPPPPPPPRAVVPQRKRWVPPQTTSLLGVQMPNFAGLKPDPEYDALFIGGFGVALGRGVGSSQVSLNFSPIAFGGVERGPNRIRSYIGADSAPLFIFNDATGSKIHLAMATTGFSIGSDRLRMGPFVSAGLLAAAVGVRAVFTPFESRIGKLTGLEARFTYFAPSTAHASLSYMNVFPLGRRVPDEKRVDVRSSTCHRFGFGAGAAGGVSSTASAWEFVGRDDAYQISWSPTATLTCENGTKATGWHLGVESAPTFFYRVPVADGGADKRLLHYGSMTFGAYAGTNTFRIGPIATAGVWTLGGGARAIFTPFKTHQGAWHGLEARALALFPSGPAFQGMLLYHVWFDPKATSSPRKAP